METPTAINNAPQTSNLPRRLSREEIAKVVGIIDKMKKEGYQPDHPKLKILSNLLKAQSYYYHRNAPQGSSMTQGNVLQGQMNQSLQGNPMQGQMNQSSMTQGNPMQGQMNQSLQGNPMQGQMNQSSMTQGNIIQGQGTNMNTMASSFTSNPSSTAQKLRFPGGMAIHPNQLIQLKAQIMAFKYLSRNLPLPQKLLFVLRDFSTKQPGNPQNINVTTVPIPANRPAPPPTPTTSGKPPSYPPPNPANARLVSPNTSLLPGTPKPPTPVPVPVPMASPKPPTPGQVPAQLPTPTPPIPIMAPVPPSKPEPLPITFIMQEREKRITARIGVYLEDLNRLQSESAERRMRVMIEQKKLKLLENQKKLRADIVQRLRRINEIDSISSDPTTFKKSRKNVKDKTLPVLPTKVVIPKEVNAEKHRDFLKSVLKHQENFKQYYHNIGKIKKKLVKDVTQYHANEERKKQAEEERKKRERLEALRHNNEEEYKRLLQETKNERLSLLLKTTDQFMERVGSMIQIQKDSDEIVEKRRELLEKTNKGKSKTTKEGEVMEESKEADKDSQTQQEETVTERNKRYYTTAHTITETTEQPQMLVGGKLKSYQLTGLQWLVSLYNNKLNGILADEMGLGKTIQTISLISYLMEKKGDNGPYLVVAPLSTISNWAMEFGKWAPSVNVVVYKGKPAVRKQMFKTELVDCTFNVCLTSYEFVMIDKSDLGKIEWNYIIVDEGHRIKNKNGKLSNILRKYVSRHRVLLTGTPLQNDLDELWALMNFLLPHIFNSNEDFHSWFNAPFEYSKKSKKGDNEMIALNEEETLLIIHTLHKVLRPFLLRRLKKEVEHDLPDKVESVIRCELSALQKRMYKNMVEEGIMYLDPDSQVSKNKRTTKGFNNTLMQLQKICNHPYLFHEEYYIDEQMIRASGKLSVLDRILLKLKNTGHRILIFNQMTQIMDLLEEYFRLREWNYLRLDGSTKAEDRADLVKVWNKPQSEHWLFILSTKAGGLGLNLQTADTVILFDTDWNPHMDLQAQDRVHRIGQQKEVRVFRFITHNTIEEKILERAAFKKDVDAKVIQAGMFNTTANDRMRKELLQKLLLEEDDNEETEVMSSDEQLNTVIARSQEEFELFQKMDKERQETELRLWKESGKKGKPPPRLIQENELKSYLFVEKKEEEVEVYGRGRRERPDVVYDDNLTDNQFARMLEGKSVKKRKSEDDDEGKEKKKRKKSKKEKSEEFDEENHKLIDEILDILSSAQDSEGTNIGSVFVKLPSKIYYPDYYQTIKHPISINKIRGEDLCDPEELKELVIQMVKNAHIYNEPNSPVYNAATSLLEVFKVEYQKRFGETEITLEE